MRKLKYSSFILCILTILVSFSTTACSHQSSAGWPGGSNTIPQIEQRAPTAPGNLTGQADSYYQITVQWLDNSDNEEGFKIYRDGIYIDSVSANITIFQDKGLSYGTTYTYCVSAYNNIGETRSSITVPIKTLNPPITVRLDRIGVIKDHDPDPFFQREGDIYLYIGVGDGKAQPYAIRIPATDTIKLNDNESVAINQYIFQTDCIGDELKIVVVAFESDPAITGLLKEVFMQSLVSYLGGGIGGAASLIVTLLQSQPTSDEGTPSGVTAESTEDDFVGAIEKIWTSVQNWGIGSYSDVTSGDLRIWFTISLGAGIYTTQ